WPADHRMRLTFRLGDHCLRLSAHIDNPDQKPLPFGLGYHPYLRTPLIPDANKAECFVRARVDSFWDLEDNLPTGTRQPLDDARDLTRPRRITELSLDDVLVVGAPPAVHDILPVVASVRQEPDGSVFLMRADLDFRELV